VPIVSRQRDVSFDPVDLSGAVDPADTISGSSGRIHDDGSPGVRRP
jgi:hypothetical protein